MNSKNRKAIFLDRDGVINDLVDRGSNFSVRGKVVRWTTPFSHKEFFLKPGIDRVLEEMGQNGFLRVLATNQPDIAYGLLSREEHDRIMSDVKNLPLDDVFICIHGRDDGCGCKKPKPGMLMDASEKWGINLEKSYMIGDHENDILAGKSAGCKTILISQSYHGGDPVPDFVASNLDVAWNFIQEAEKYENIY